MKPTRRSFFGWIAGAVAGAKITTSVIAKPKPQLVRTTYEEIDGVQFSVRKETISCPYTFKDKLCTYNGPMKFCDKTTFCCDALGNLQNFGGMLC